MLAFQRPIHLQHLLTGRKCFTLPFVRFKVNKKPRRIGAFSLQPSPSRCPPTLLITGEDLIQVAYQPPDRFSKSFFLTAVEDAQLDRKISTKEEAMELVRGLATQISRAAYRWWSRYFFQAARVSTGSPNSIFASGYIASKLRCEAYPRLSNAAVTVSRI